jgi:hypothetical protein
MKYPAVLIGFVVGLAELVGISDVVDYRRLEIRLDLSTMFWPHSCRHEHLPLDDLFAA